MHVCVYACVQCMCMCVDVHACRYTCTVAVYAHSQLKGRGQMAADRECTSERAESPKGTTQGTTLLGCR